LSIVVLSFVCSFSSDSKRFAAYSSVVHMGLVTWILFQFSIFSKSSSIFFMISHGLVSSLLFYLVGILYLSLGTRIVYFNTGL
jgi:NADH:ubiquinone oxidoreductase subunit 4 (subunit M)